MHTRTALFALCAGLSLVAPPAFAGGAKEAAAPMPAPAAPAVQTPAPRILTLCVPKAPPALPVLRMMETGALGAEVEIKLSIWDTPEQLIAMVQDPKSDIFAFPLTVFAKLYNKGLDVRLTNVNTWGVTYFLTTDPSLKDWKDLKGKTVYIPLKSSPPDVLTQFFLKRAGLDPAKDLTIVYSTTTEVGQLMKAGAIAYATQIEPMVSAVIAGNPAARIAFDFEEEWRKVKGDDSMLPNAGMGTRAGFIEKNPELTARFEREYEKALNWIIEHPAETGALAEKYLGLNAGLVARALPTSGIAYRRAADADEGLKALYALLLDFDPTTIGGKIPDDRMYYR